MTTMQSARARTWLFFIVTCIIGALLYVPHLDAPMVFDDIGYFSSNYVTKCGIGFHPDVPRWLPCWTFAVPKVILGEDFMHFFRLGNLALHILTVNALFFFLKRLYSAFAPEAKNTDLIAAVSALIFLLHPISIYAVAYLVERSTLMATLFSILMLSFHLRGMESRNPAWFLASVLFCYLAIYSKEHSVMVPFIAFLLTIALRDRNLPWRWLAFVFFAYAFFSISVVFQVKAVIGSSYEPESADILAQISSAVPHNLYLTSVLSQSLYFFKYIFLWLLPITRWMSIDMQQSIVDTASSPLYWLTASCFLAWCLAGFMLVWKRGMHALLGFAMLAPALLFATEFASIRIQEPFVLYRSYLWAPFIFSAMPLLLNTCKVRHIIFAGIFVAAILSVLTHEKLKTFDSSYALWDDAIRLAEKDDMKTPMRARQYTSRGLAFLVNKHPQDALNDFDHALTYSRRYILAIHGRGMAYMQLGRYQDAKASFSQALRIKPDFIQSMIARSFACSNLNDNACRDHDLERACQLGAPLACYMLFKNRHPQGGEFSIH